MDDNFCVAWFASEGIQQVAWSEILREDQELERLVLAASQNSSASRDLTPRALSLASDSEDETETQNDDDDDVMDAAVNGNADSKTGTKADDKAVDAASLLARRIPSQTDAAAAENATTFQWKRKGTPTILSPEWRGYRRPIEVLLPFCYAPSFVGDLFAKAHMEDPADYSRATLAVRGVTLARPESYCLCVDQIPQSASQESRLRRLEDRRELRRAVLPRVVKHARTAQPVVQFLNVDKGSAVTFLTPELACGNLPEPMTILIVGIATEDGCFLSGLRHRFEVGHLYPRDQLAEITDSSAFCVLTEGWGGVNDILMPPDEEKNGDNVESDEDDDEEDEEEEDLLAVSDYPCNCIFDGVTEKLSVLNDQDDSNGRLMRGEIGPGDWHCYTIVVDGEDSCLRMDGLTEPLERREGSGDQGCFLDGLTLGSDHCFGMSLCCGQGSPGEGEGALAEVVVFSGRLDHQDICALEGHLMNKHGIAPRQESSWQEDDLSRQAAALFQLVSNPRGTRVPLRYMARQPIVAWQVRNPVTEQVIPRDRIGAAGGGSSSDW
jgi:hypothetical protein